MEGLSCFEIRNLQGTSTESCDKRLDEWLKTLLNELLRLTTMHYAWQQRITVLWNTAYTVSAKH